MTNISTEARAKSLITRMDTLRTPGSRPTQDAPGEYEALEWELAPLIDELIGERTGRTYQEYTAEHAAEIKRIRAL